MSEFAIEAEDLTKQYGLLKAVDSLSVEIQSGGITGLIGRNGSGKTTFMKLCAGLTQVSGGRLEVFGETPMDNIAVLDRLVYIHSGIVYEDQLKLRAILKNYAAMFTRFDLAFAQRLLDYFHLSPKLSYKGLSQGMRGVFNFICGLSCRAELTLLDEPVLGLDAPSRKAVYEIMLRDYTEYPRTIIVSSHLLAELEGILSDILLIDNGKLILHSNTDDLKQSVYHAEGDSSGLEAFCRGKKIIWSKKGPFRHEAVIMECFDDAVAIGAERYGVQVAGVRLEDLCIYLTPSRKEGDLECLWQKTN